MALRSHEHEHLVMAQSRAKRVASSLMARCRLSIVREVRRRCVLGHVRLGRADDGAWPRLRFRPAVGPSAAVRRTVNHVRLRVAKALLAGSVQLEALGAPVGYRRKLAATELARAPYPLFPAPFCGALSARSSICASLACNTPTALRATYPYAKRTNPVRGRRSQLFGC